MAATDCFTIFLLLITTLILFPTAALGLLPHHLGRKKSSTAAAAVIKAINDEGPYFGLITVYSPEENAFFATADFRNHSKYPYVNLSGRRFRVGTIQGKKVIYVRCGIGMVNAAGATQQMVDLFNIKGLIHFGISGNTNSSLSIGDVIIPFQFANTGLWDWLKPNGTVPSGDVGKLEFGNYNVPKAGNNSLGRIGYSPEQFYSEGGEANVAQQILWFQVTKKWHTLATTTLQGTKLEQCVNSSLCLEDKPRVVVGVGYRGSTADTFLDNAAYREFLFRTFGVSSADMESSAVVMTSLSNGFPVIVIRGLSDLAGGQDGENSIRLFGSLAATNVAKVVLQFIDSFPNKLYHSI